MKSMYLPQVENNPDAAGAYVPLIGALGSAGLPVPQIMHLFAFKHEATQHLQRFTQAVMRGPSPLTAAFRELIAAFVSSRNRCRFCTGSHVAVAAKLSGDRPVVDAVIANYRTAPIEEREKALLAYLEGLTAEPISASEGKVEELRQAGWSDEAIYDAVTVCALFNYYNRWVEGSGVRDMPAEAYEKSGERLAGQGYVGAAVDGGMGTVTR
jgi:uncharacterized peroxidase-related enzyme